MNYTGSNASERLIFVDAANRDSNLYPTGSSYVLHLTRPIRNGLNEDIQFTEYDESYQGHYSWHTDLGSGTSSTRKLSIVVQLSEPWTWKSIYSCFRY